MAERIECLEDDQFPALYRAQSERSARAQRDVLTAVKVSLGGALVAAVLGAFEVKRNDVDFAALGASLGFLLSLFASSWLLWRRPERDWYDARASAESIKTLTWQFAVAGGEFASKDESDAETRSRFLARLREILDGLRGVGTPVSANGSQISRTMLELRASSLELRQSAYRTGRIEDQQDWYAKKAGWNEKQRKIWATITLLLQAAGFGGGIARAFFALEVDSLGIAAALVAAATAWARTKDYAELAEAYAVTSQEIGLLRGEVMPTNEADWGVFVERAERAFSREHTLWRARKGQREI
jgi:hypothetical protein